MGAWSFNRRFEKALENGVAQAHGEAIPHPGELVKRSTIRLARRDGRDPEAGTEQRLWIAQRTPERRFLGTVRILCRQTITLPSAGVIRIESRPPPIVRDLVCLANREGFDSLLEFGDFFRDVHGFPFSGLFYQW